jgi:hypothetical protein
MLRLKVWEKMQRTHLWMNVATTTAHLHYADYLSTTSMNALMIHMVSAPLQLMMTQFQKDQNRGKKTLVLKIPTGS